MGRSEVCCVDEIHGSNKSTPQFRFFLHKYYPKFQHSPICNPRAASGSFCSPSVLLELSAGRVALTLRTLPIQRICWHTDKSIHGPGIVGICGSACGARAVCALETLRLPSDVQSTNNSTNMVPNIELVGTSAGRREYTAVEDIWNLRCLCLRFLLFLRSPTARDAKQALPTFHKYCKLHEARIHHFLSTRVIGGLKYINPGSRRQKADPQSASAPVVGSVKCTNLHW